MEAIAKQFVDYYYNTFDTIPADEGQLNARKASLQSLYRDGSMLSWEGSQILGGAAIVEKIASLPFQKVLHKVTTIDPQPTSETNLVVLVTGQLVVDDSTNPIHFSQIFHLISDAGSYYVQNDVFRLNYG
ncbi:nuclear transport factor 2 [Clavulina sp. PMI_390]|nr:nuclear transport factor 2 [Clavulina sp. PMI_390]